MDMSEARDELRVFINPEILAAEGEAECEEGCLSVPGYYDKVTRAARIRVRALDARGKPFELDAEGMLAVCIQHEMDHLVGKVFVDHLSPLKRRGSPRGCARSSGSRAERASGPAMNVGFAGTPAFAADGAARRCSTRASRFRWC